MVGVEHTSPIVALGYSQFDPPMSAATIVIEMRFALTKQGRIILLASQGLPSLKLIGIPIHRVLYVKKPTILIRCVISFDMPRFDPG
jgi:hypothetical protein